MKSVEFPEQTVVIAKDQPEYHPLPAHVEGGVVTSCWEPDAEDIRNLAKYGKLYVSQCTFGGPLQPLTVQTVFNPPKLPQPATQVTQAEKEPNKLEEIADLRGLSGPFLFAMDGESVPGKVICHFVRLETIAFDADEKPKNIKAMSNKADPRLPFLAAIFTEPQQQCVVHLMRTLKLCADALELIVVKVKGLPPPVMAFIQNSYKTAHKAFETYG